MSQKFWSTRRTTAAVTLLLISGLLVAGSGRAFGNTQSAAPLRMAPAGRGVVGRYIVVLRDGVARASANRASALAGVQIHHVYENSVRGFAAQMSDAALAQVRADPDVAYVEQDRLVHLVDSSQPNPPWGLDRIDQRSLPLNDSYSYDGEAQDVHAYVIDTGIRSTHSEFAGRVELGFDAVDGGAPDDCNGHGTHVAGTIGGTTYGVAKYVTLHAVRVLDCEGSGYDSDVIAGIDWVTQEYTTYYSPTVANMSLGGDASDALDAAVRASVEAGVVFVVAAGNDDADACYESPAREASAITVGATDSSDARAWFSNHGACVDIFAPGVDIDSAWHSSNTAIASLSGTSMAAPHVAGAVALLLQANQEAKPAEIAAALMNAATNGVVTDAMSGSPNRLLYTKGATGPTPTPRPTSTPPAGQGANAFDNPATPRVISAFPFNDVANVSAATTSRGSEPWPMNCGDVENANTVWYRFTAPASGWLTLDTAGSNYDTVLEAYEIFEDPPTSSGSFSFITCNDDDDEALQARMGMEVTAGTAYFLQAAAFKNGMVDPASKQLVLHATLAVGGTGPTPTPTPAGVPTPLPVDTPSPTQPWINNLWPETTQVGRDEWIWVTGGNFDDVTTVRLGGQTMQTDPINDEAMFVYAPDDLPAGTYDLQVCNGQGECATKPEAYTVYGLLPEITFIWPDRVAYGESTDVYMHGINFAEGMSVTIGGEPVTEIEVYSSGAIRVRPSVNLGVGVHNVEAFTADAHAYFPQAFTVFGSESDDWFAFEEDLWSTPLVVRSGDVIELGLNVHRQGGEIPMQAGVSFYEVVDGTPQLIDRVLTPPMVPGADVIESVSTLWSVTTTGDSVTVVAVIDEDEWIDDLNRANNIVTRTISILPPSDDSSAPGVSSFRLDGGAAETADAQVMVEVGVTETVSAMYIVEREFNTVAGLWVPVQNTGWIAYQSSYPLTLTGSSGLRYLQAWVSDEAGNISSRGGYAVINYNKSPEAIALGQMRMFRYPVALGLTATVRLETISGDADLYVWNPDGTLAGSSVQPGTADDEVAVTAGISGEHQVEVYGYAAGQYRLTIDYGTDARPAGSNVGGARPAAKALRAAPVVRPEDLPAGVVALANAPVGGLPSAPAATPAATAPSPTATPTATPARTPTATPTSGGESRVYVPLVRRQN